MVNTQVTWGLGYIYFCFFLSDTRGCNYFIKIIPDSWWKSNVINPRRPTLVSNPDTASTSCSIVFIDNQNWSSSKLSSLFMKFRSKIFHERKKLWNMSRRWNVHNYHTLRLSSSSFNCPTNDDAKRSSFDTEKRHLYCFHK